MVEELLEQDGLCIMAAGLGWQKVAAVLMRIQIHRRRSADLPPSHCNMFTIAFVSGVQGLCWSAELAAVDQLHLCTAAASFTQDSWTFCAGILLSAAPCWCLAAASGRGTCCGKSCSAWTPGEPWTRLLRSSWPQPQSLHSSPQEMRLRSAGSLLHT